MGQSLWRSAIASRKSAMMRKQPEAISGVLHGFGDRFSLAMLAQKRV